MRDRVKELRRVPASELRANPKNWRRHPPAQEAALRGVLEDIGFADAVIARETDDGLELIDGHLRQEVMGDQVIPVLIVDVTEEEADKMLLTHDPLAMMAHADQDQLQHLLQSTQFEDRAVNDMLEALANGDRMPDLSEPVEDPGPQIDRADELRQKWQTERGQVWEVGRHRLMCGDSQQYNQSEGLDLVFDPDWNIEQLGVPDFKSALVFTDGRRAHESLERFGPPAWVFVWDCVTSWYTPNRPLQRHKLCFWYGSVDAYRFDGAHYGTAGESRQVQNTRGRYVFHPDPRGKHLADIFQYPLPRLHAGGLHSHQKPVDWMRLLLGNCTSGDVYDPFLGSGTTMVAAEQLGRICYGVEIEPKYVAVTLERMAGMGLEPKLDTG